jgi:hypothetical protein
MNAYMVMMTLSLQYDSWQEKSPHPDERTTKYGSPRCNMIHHIPSTRAHCDSKRKGDIYIALLRLLIVFDWWKHINIDVTLPFWVTMRSGRRNVMNHIASRGTIFGRSFVGVRGFFLPWVRDITPPRNWRHKKFECSKIHIWSWWRSRCSMTHGKKNPRTPTKERPNMVPLDAIWFITFRLPERCE